MSAVALGPFRDVAAVVVAAGQGLRAGQPVPKQFANWRGKPVVRHSVETLAASGVSAIVTVIPAGSEQIAREALQDIPGVRLVVGGETRRQSVWLGLEALVGDPPSRVLIHDAARPQLPQAIIDRLLTSLDSNRAAIPVLPIVDSLASDQGGTMGDPADRSLLRRVQTPQAFDFEAILTAHRCWNKATEASDDAQIARAAGIEVAMIEGDEALKKLTYSRDFRSDAPPVRIGVGYDVHRLAEGEALWLCGVRIDHPKGLVGHSDADVAIHALVDALLGAIGAGDIGQHFPPSDPKWRGASSDHFLIYAAELVDNAGYMVGNIDVTIVCEAPKIGQHRETMRLRLAALLGVDISTVSVKATTTERLGFTGRGEGIAAHAAVSLFRM